jgi:hypothetical protein
MKLTCLSFALFALAFAVHWLAWRVHLPKRQTAVLLGILFGTLGCGLLVVSVVPALEPWRPVGVWEILQVVLFHTSFTLAYVVAYSALEERSPSMTVLLAIADAEPAGLSRAETIAILARMSPLKSRLEAMIRDRMIDCDGTCYRVTPKGAAWARVLGTWRRLAGLPKGG